MTDLQLILLFVIGVLATARLTKLIVEDDWPPTMWFREWYIVKLTKGNGWAKLVECVFCVAPWVALVNVGLAWLSFDGDGSLDWWWLIPNLWLATSYAAAMTVARDIPPES